MRMAKIAVFVVFCCLLVASLALEAAWDFHGVTDAVRWQWQPKLVYAVLGLCLVQAGLYAIAPRKDNP